MLVWEAGLMVVPLVGDRGLKAGVVQRIEGICHDPDPLEYRGAERFLNDVEDEPWLGSNSRVSYQL